MTAPAAHLRSVPSFRNERGYTLTELLMVLPIIGILCSAAVAGYGHFTNKAKAAVLQSLTHILKIEVDSLVEDFDLLHRYGERSYDTSFLSGRLERTWENTPGRNTFGHRNPFSSKGTVLNWAAVPLSVDNPAIFITNNEHYAFDGMPDGEIRPELRGSVVIHLRNNVRQIDIFYFDLSARKSAFRLVTGLNR